jgi:hypothetical protein
MGIMESQARIRAAAKATDAVDAAIDWVCVMREHYRDRNVLGVFAHPHALRAHLAEAREAIGRAEEIVRKTQWPTDFSGRLSIASPTAASCYAVTAGRYGGTKAQPPGSPPLPDFARSFETFSSFVLLSDSKATRCRFAVLLPPLCFDYCLTEIEP